MNIYEIVHLMARGQFEAARVRPPLPHPAEVRWSTYAAQQLADGDEEYARRLVKRYCL